MHYKPGKDKGMIQLPFRIGLITAPSAKHWTKIIRIPSKKTELSTAAPPRFYHFLPEELFE